MNIKRLLCWFVLSFCASTVSVAEQEGARVFKHWCSHCHAEGSGHPGTQRLGWDKGEKFAVLEQRKDLAPAYIKYVVRNGYREMPNFRITEISESELEALTRYLQPNKE